MYCSNCGHKLENLPAEGKKDSRNWFSVSGDYRRHGNSGFSLEDVRRYSQAVNNDDQPVLCVEFFVGVGVVVEGIDNQKRFLRVFKEFKQNEK